MEILASARRFIGSHRRAIAAAIAGLGTFVLVTQLTPAVPDAIPVVVALHDLSPGDILGAADVAVRELPAAGVPEGAGLTTDDVVGQTLAAGVSANTVLQPGLLASADRAGPGRALVPVRIPDEQLLQLLTPGTLVGLVSTTEAGASVLVDDARVALVPAASPQTGFAATGARPGLVVLDVPKERAADVAVLGQRAELNVVLG